MNAQTTVERGVSMKDDGVFQMRYYRSLNTYTVEMEDGRMGKGKTTREAVDNAQTLTACLASISGDAT